MSPQKSAGRDAGFSLIELLCVIVVLGVLATIVVMSVGGTTDRATEAARAADERTIASAMESYQAQNGYYASEARLVEAGFLRAESDLWDVVVDEDANQFTLVSTGGSATTDTTDTTDGPATTEAPDVTAAPTTAAPTTAAPVTTAAPTTVAPTTAAPVTTAAPATTLPSATGITCSFVVNDAWDTGGNAALSITNATDARITSWTVRIAHEGRTVGLWGASGAGSDGTHLTASDAGWNGTIAAGRTVTVTGGSISGAGLSDGQAFGCSVVPVVAEASSVTCNFEVGTAWGSAGNGTLSITNGTSTQVTSWTVQIATTPTASISLWNATNAVGDSTLTASSLGWNGVVDAGATVSPTGGRVSGSGISTGDSFDCTVVSVG